jgi:hypothetical protein
VDRQELLKAVEIDVLRELERVLRSGTRGTASRTRLRSMAAAYRRFANERRRSYELIYSRHAFADPDIAAATRFAAGPLFEELEKAGIARDRSLPLARTLTAFLHGFVSMEIADAFRLGGSVEDAFDKGLATILREV